MNKENLETPFPKTRQDLSDLKDNATSAAREIGSTASNHVEKAKGQVNDLATHAKKESHAQLDQVRVSVSELGDKVRDYVSARPLAAIGTALAVGFLVGLSRRGARQS